MATSTPFVLNDKSQAAFIAYYTQVMSIVRDTKSAQRKRFEKVDIAYQREQDKSDEALQLKLNVEKGDFSRVPDITVPVVMPQIEAAVVYQSSVFLTGVPLFGVAANPEFIDEALQMETALDNHATKGGWIKELMLHFRDGAKYNFAPMEVSWGKEKTVNIATDLDFSATEGRPTETIWQGNTLKRLDPYNTFVDPRVAASEVYKKGEFGGHTEYLSRIQLKQFIAEMDGTLTQNITKAFESAQQVDPTTQDVDNTTNFYVPDINPDVNASDDYSGNMNWLSWAEVSGNKKAGGIKYKNSYEKTVLYCKILPSEFGLKVPGSNTPQIWKLIIINHSVIIFSERQTNAHNWIPILIGEPKEDGLDSQTKSAAEDAKPFQEVASALMKSILASRRRAISDRTIYDPSRISDAHINSENPSAKIPVRPSAYGKNVSDAVHQFPYREDQGSFGLAQIKDFINMANQLSGQNPARQGQFVKGNKTRQEFEDTMGNSNGRDQLAAILAEVQIFAPMKHMFKINILQYQGQETFYSREKEVDVTIDPVKLRNSVLEFKISDGLIPSDKIINSDAWAVAIQTIGSSPEIGAGYNLAPMFSYMMKTQGAKINSFEKSPEQMAYEQALGSWNSLMRVAIEKGLDPEKLGAGEMPKPEEYGYNPNPEAKPNEEEEDTLTSQQAPQTQQ